MTVPELIVDVGFTAPTTGSALHIGDPVRGIIGTGTIASSDLFTDVSEYVVSVNIRRGATRADGPVLRYEAGTATIVLRNDDRRFDPTNLDGPYVASGVTQVEPMRAVRIRAVWDGVAYPMFRGFTDDWHVDYDGPNSSFVTLTCFDAFGVFASYDRNASAAVGSGEDTGARINRILDSITWPDEDRMIDTGDETVQSTTLADNTLSELQLTADTELGHLYLDTSGRVRFHRRLADSEDPESVYAQACFGDSPEDADTTVNLVSNPSAESGTTGWTAGGSVTPTLAQSSAQAQFGTSSLLVTWGTGGVLPNANYDVSGLTVGRTYTFSVYVRVPAGSPQVVTIVAGTNQFGGISTVNDAWERLSWTGTATATTMGFQVWPVTSPTAGQQVYLDGLQAEEGTSATTYVDGTQSGCEWDAVAHASTSRRLPELPYADAPLVSDRQSIANLISIANSGGTAQEVEDAASRSSYLTKTFQRHDLLMQTDAEALLYADQLLARSSSPELRFQRLELKPTRDERLWPQALGRRFGDRVRIRRRPPGGGDVIEREVHIRGVEHETDKEQRWVTRLVLQQAPDYTTISDTFTRTTSPGWGTSDTGHVWSSSDAVFSVNGSAGVTTHTAANTVANLITGSTFANCRGRVKLSIGQKLTGTGAMLFELLARYVDASNYYVFSLYFEGSGTATGPVGVLLSKVVSGARTDLFANFAFDAHNGTETFWLKYECVGRTLRIKVWRTTVSEPSTWTSTVTDSTFTTGSVGVQSIRGANVTNVNPFMRWDDLSITTLHAWT